MFFITQYQALHSRSLEHLNLYHTVHYPIINQPSPASGMPNAFGLGDINPSLFFSPTNSGKLIWGRWADDDASNGNQLATARQWEVERGIGLGGTHHAGALANNQWSFRGQKERECAYLKTQNFPLPPAPWVFAIGNGRAF
jgi:hypothetical protein